MSAINHQSLADQMSEILMRRILSGEYPPGSRIVESRVAREHGVSQAPVREALRQLVAVGLVKNMPHRGAVVREVTTADLDVLIPVRAKLEGVAARLATKEFAGDVTPLMYEVAGMKSAAAEKNHEKHYLHSFDFHRIIAHSAANPHVVWLFDCMAFQARLQFYLNTAKRLTAKQLSANAEAHRVLADVIASGDPERAEKLMYEHCLSYVETH